MINRYSRKEIKNIWSEQNKFQKWLDVELAACYAHVQLGNITQDEYEDIKSKAKFDINRINEIESEIHHDVIAFLTAVAENVGPNSRLIHLGLTSSDVVDTAFSLLIQESGKIILKDLISFMETLKEKAEKHKLTPMMGRTHGVHAEPLTFGLKLAVWYEEFKRNKVRLENALEDLRVGKISGAVGNYAHMSPELEKIVCEKLNLKQSKASTQTLQRDRHAAFLTTVAVISGSLEKIAIEIRSLQKTETNEVLEPFSSKQKGSSAMPHKKNPIISERVTGLARVIRGYAVTSLENQALWHERDISHSSTERIIFPDATILIDYMFSKMENVIKGLVVNEKKMEENIGKSYHVFYSQQLLLKLVDKGLLREKAYRIVQKNAHEAFEEGVLFEEKIRSDESITETITSSELNQIFDFKTYTKNIDLIYDRVFS